MSTCSHVKPVRPMRHDSPSLDISENKFIPEKKKMNDRLKYLSQLENVATIFLNGHI